MDQQFVKNIETMRGEAGTKWLADIPRLIQYYEEKWEITVLEPFSLTCNYVAPVVRSDGSSAVLKMRFPKDREFPSEMKSLELFSGKGAVELLTVDEENAVLLLERAEPGNDLKTIHEEEKVAAIFIQVLSQLEKPISENDTFQTLADWGKWFDRLRKVHGGTGPFPQKLYDRAEHIFLEYSASNPHQYLLHGDLRKGNILLSERGWLAIDPRGIIGEREFETATFLQNLFYDKSINNPKEMLERLVAQFAHELGFDKQRMRNWAFAQSMLNALWIYEDYKEVDKVRIQNAQRLYELLG